MSGRIGELLVKKGVITDAQLADAKDKNAATGGASLMTTLVQLGYLNQESLLGTLSKEFGVQILTFDDLKIEPSALDVVPRDFAQKHMLMPVTVAGGVLTVAMADPSNITAVNDIKFISGCDVKVLIGPEPQIRAAIEKHYEENISYDSIFDDLEGDVEVLSSEEELDVQALERATEDAPVVKLVNAILTDAVKKGASDIHIEPYEKVFRVRFRIDGVLYEIMKPPYKLKNAIISRVKIMADLDIAERRLPQDGRIKLKFGERREMDFRVSVLPGLFGEKVVLRLLDKSTLQTDLTKLGFDQKQFKDFGSAIDKPYGLILVTGPTGSGKTTTLYSALTELNKSTVNISTAEDPVEYNLYGINQVQMHEEIGLNFAAALRSFLRQDPDIVMVGEIRDYETAEIAIKASLTGHLVLSTLHTNDAPSTINRLLNMGIEPFLLSSSINIVVAQRLARLICEKCKEPQRVNPQALIDVGITPEDAEGFTAFHGKGCERCSGTGYKGRLAVYECMLMTDELREFVLSGASAAEIKREAIRQGMSTLRMSAVQLLRNGLTTLEEVVRVTAAD